MNRKAIFSSLLLSSSILLSSSAFAQVFIPGRLIVARVGDGTTLDTSARGGFRLFSSNKLTGAPTQIINFPFEVTLNSNTATTTSFTTSFLQDDGKINRSQNGLFLSLAGFSTSTAATGIASSTTPRRIMNAPFTAELINNPTYSILNPTTGIVQASGSIMQAVSSNGGDTYVATEGGLFFMAAGSTTATQLVTEPVYSVQIAGGNIFYIGDSGFNRITGLPTSGTPTVTNLSNDTSLQMIEFINGTTAIAASWQTSGLRRMTLSSGNWSTTSGGAAITFSTIDNSVDTLSNIETDGIRAYSVNYDSGPNTLRGYSTITGAATLTTLHAAAANTSYRGLSLAPEVSVVASAYSGTSGVQRVAMRTVGTGTDAYTRSIRVANVNFSDYRNATTLATVPYRGHIQDMAVDNNGNTLLLNVVPNTSFTGWVYSIIRVSADGTQTDEGPVNGSGEPNQAAPGALMPVAIAAHPTTNQAAVLFQNTTTNQCQAGIVTLPGSIGSGVATGNITNWGAFVSSTGAQRAVEIAYSAAGNLRVLFSEFTGGNGAGQVLTLNSATVNDSTSFSTFSTISGMQPIGLAFDALGNARILESGSANNRPNIFRVDTSNSGASTFATTGTQYTRDSAVNNTVTSAAIFNQGMATGISYDRALSVPVVTLAGTNGSLNTTTLAGDQRLNIPGSFRAWRLDNTTNAAALATYRFMPGFNLN
jgi:hypothetical protein